MPRLVLTALLVLGLAGLASPLRASATARPLLAVVVLDAAGRPVAGARVAVAEGAAGREELGRLADAAGGAARTDAGGLAQLAAEPGWVTVAAFAPGEPLRGAVVAARVRRAGTQVKLVLEPGEAIAGVVVDGSGRPVAGVEVRALPDVDPLGPEPRGLGAARTDAAGAFVLGGVDARTYRLVARGEGHVGPLGQRPVSGGARGLTLRVERGRLLRGAVADEEGTPLDGAEVRAADGRVLARAGEGGQFEAVVSPGPVDLSFAHPGHLPLTRRLAAEEEVVEVALSSGARLKLLAVDEQGEPVPGAELTIRAGEQQASCRTDAAGRCEVGGLPLGEGAITAGPGAAGGIAPPATVVRLAPGKAQEVQLRLPRRPSRLTVHVVDGQGQELSRPAAVFPGAPGLAQAVDGRREPRLPCHQARARTPLENLPADGYTVVAVDASRRQCAVTVLALHAGEDKEITLRLGDGSCR